MEEPNIISLLNLRRFARFSAFLAFIIGLTVLIGWNSDFETLKTFFDDYNPMKPSSAGCFILLGSSLWFLSKNEVSRSSKIFVLISSGIVVLFGVATILEYITGQDFHIDGLLIFREYYVVNTLRTAAIGTVTFIISGTSLILITYKKKIELVQIMLLFAWVLSLFSILSYLTGIKFQEETLVLRPMSLYLSLTILLFLPGVLSITNEKGIVASLLGQGTGSTIARRVVPFAILAPFILAILRLKGEQHGLYGRDVGLILFATFCIMIFIAATWWCINNIENIESEKKHTQEALLSSGINIKEYETRINKILDVLLKFTTMDFSSRLELGEKGDELDAIALSLNTLSEELQAKNYTLKLNEERLNEIMEALLRFTMMDFSQKLELRGNGDEWDAIALGLNTLSEELESHIEKLKESENKFKLIVDSVQDYAIFMVDTSGRIAGWNQGAEHIKGYTAEEVIGKHISIFYTPEEIERGEPEHNLRVTKENGRHETEGWRVRKDGSRFWADVVFTALYNEKGVLQGYSKITRDLTERKEAEKRIQQQTWILSGISEVNDSMRGDKSAETLAQDVINKMAELTKAQIGTIYFNENDHHLNFKAGYAFSKENEKNKTIRFGEGLIGQAAKEKKRIIFKNVPENYIKINSSLGAISPKEIVVQPLLYEYKVIAVMELGSLDGFTSLELELLNLISENIAITINSSQSREQTQVLLVQTQHQAEELESQQEELRQTNEELNKQTQLLQSSEEELRVQQEELQQANIELEEKTQELILKNDSLEQARNAIMAKAEEVAQTSKYKSEFLANMSHELRTPLNSILILAKLLSDNKDKNLTEKQAEYARIVYKSGNDLLNLINDILDLSKIEAGKVELNVENVPLSEVVNDINSLFNEVAINKKITFKCDIEDSLKQAVIKTDKIRLEQVLRNLLSNAFKFTSIEGSVFLKINKTKHNQSYNHQSLKNAENILAFSVSDTGIGIPKDKFNLIFEAFQQADGSTSRRYGGTGLGLSISRELISLLGGEIHVESKEGEGSTFTIFIPADSLTVQKPLTRDQPNEEANRLSEKIAANTEPLEEPQSEEKIILIIEDDESFAKILEDLASDRGYKPIVATQGDMGLEYAYRYMPAAIILDMQLPVIDGWTLLKRFKEDERLKHIPVHIMSVMDKKQMGLSMGAITYTHKPLDFAELNKSFDDISISMDEKLKNLLIIEDNEVHNDTIAQLIKSHQENVACFSAYNGKEAFDILERNNIDCIILDLGLSDISGLDLLKQLKSDERYASIPIIVNTARDITPEENKIFKKHAATIILKSSKSHNRLLDEAILFLHKVKETKPGSKSRKASKQDQIKDILEEKVVLIADDDMRNVFSLSAALEFHGLIIVAAADGKEALRKLDENKVDIVLMDIMMPEMDGYEAMQAIRKVEKYKNLPIIALTAKAMKEDREKCIKAGASDYISKPVNISQLLSLMRTWLFK